MARVEKINIKKVRNNAKIPEITGGNWYDCFVSGAYVTKLTKFNEELDWKRANEEMITNGMVRYEKGDILVVFLGIAVDLGKGYEGDLIPRSSTFTKKGLLLTNSLGLIDSSYNGNNDEWKAVFYATHPGSISIGDRLLQMTRKKTDVFKFEEVEDLGNEDRGGYGSTGK